MAKVTKEQFEEWLENHVTCKFFEAMWIYYEMTHRRLGAQAMSTEYLTPERQVELAVQKGRALMAEDLSGLDFEMFEQLGSEE